MLFSVYATVKHVLADGPTPTVTKRRYLPYAQITDPYQRRRAIVDLHAEGWSHTAISTYLQTPRHRVYEVLKRWALFGHKGLEDIPQWHARKAGTHEIDEVGKLVQESPELGAPPGSTWVSAFSELEIVRGARSGAGTRHRLGVQRLAQN